MKNEFEFADRVYIFRDGIETLNKVKPRYEKEYRVIKRRADCKSFTNLFWHLFSGFSFYKYSVIDVDSGEEIIYDHAVKTLPHFDSIFRLGGGIHIGPSYANPKYRGKGFHPYIIAYITEELKSKYTIFIYVAEENIASIKGVEKVGFSYVARMKRDEFQYKLIEGTELIPIKRNSNKVWSFIFHLASFILKKVIKKI